MLPQTVSSGDNARMLGDKDGAPREQKDGAPRTQDPGHDVNGSGMCTVFGITFQNPLSFNKHCKNAVAMTEGQTCQRGMTCCSSMWTAPGFRSELRLTDKTNEYSRDGVGWSDHECGHDKCLGDPLWAQLDTGDHRMCGLHRNARIVVKDACQDFLCCPCLPVKSRQ